MGRVWFVTGSSKGLGLAIVETALADGDNVVATARNPSSLHHLSGGEVWLCTVRAAEKYFDPIDIVINNAGYADIGSLEDIPIASFKSQIEVNLMGAVYITKAVVPLLRKQNFSHPLQVSCVGGRLATPGLSAYQAAKWALGGISSVVAKELAAFNIKITVLEPGGMRTDWAGCSDGQIPTSEPYQKTVGEFRSLLQKYSSFRSDPTKVADVILKVTKPNEPPLRFLIGLETLDLAREASQQLSS